MTVSSTDPAVPSRFPVDADCHEVDTPALTAQATGTTSGATSPCSQATTPNAATAPSMSPAQINRTVNQMPATAYSPEVLPQHPGFPTPLLRPPIGIAPGSPYLAASPLLMMPTIPPAFYNLGEAPAAPGDGSVVHPLSPQMAASPTTVASPRGLSDASKLGYYVSPMVTFSPNHAMVTPSSPMFTGAGGLHLVPPSSPLSGYAMSPGYPSELAAQYIHAMRLQMQNQQRTQMQTLVTPNVPGAESQPSEYWQAEGEIQENMPYSHYGKKKADIDRAAMAGCAPVNLMTTEMTDESGVFQSKADTSNGDIVNSVMYAKYLTEGLLKDMSIETTVDILKTALTLLGRSQNDGKPSTGMHSTNTAAGSTGMPESVSSADDMVNPNSMPWVKLVHPDEFRNPSTFLKIYGDPLCFTVNGPLPKRGRDGNWECNRCQNVNFPRRYRCNMCSTARGEEGDAIVSEYARQVYDRYLAIYRYHQQMDSNSQSNRRDPVAHGAGVLPMIGANFQPAPNARNNHNNTNSRRNIRTNVQGTNSRWSKPPPPGAPQIQGAQEVRY